MPLFHKSWGPRIKIIRRSKRPRKGGSDLGRPLAYRILAIVEGGKYLDFLRWHRTNESIAAEIRFGGITDIIGTEETPSGGPESVAFAAAGRE